MKTHQFKFSDQTASFENYMDFYLKNKSTDCILYSEDCSKFKVHKELFGQTNFLREILSSTKDQCCGTIEVLCPCSKEELGHLVNFLYDGEIHCEKESDSLTIIENLQKIFGFPRNLDLTYQNVTVSSSFNNIQAVTIIEEVFEDILDDPNAEKIPLRSKDVTGKLIESDQNKGDDVFDNGEKKVLEKRKKSKNKFRKKVKVSLIKTYPKIFCNDCGASFIRKQVLQRHIDAIHLKLKPYVCDQCKKSFAQKGCLKTHIIGVHQEIETLKCKYCNRKCSTKYVLASHVKKVHLKLKPPKKVVCTECDAHFEHKQHLEHHMNKVHLNVKPYECSFCKETFFINGHLKIHIKRLRHLISHRES